MSGERTFGDYPDYAFNKMVDEAIYKALEMGNAYNSSF